MTTRAMISCEKKKIKNGRVQVAFELLLRNTEARMEDDYLVVVDLPCRDSLCACRCSVLCKASELSILTRKEKRAGRI